MRTIKIQYRFIQGGKVRHGYCMVYPGNPIDALWHAKKIIASIHPRDNQPEIKGKHGWAHIYSPQI